MEQAKVVYSSEQIAEAIKKVADKINLDYKDSTHPIVAVCLLKGAVLFYADLVRHLNIPVRFDFMSASSYGNGTVSSGKVNITKDLEYDIKDADVILIDDIVDSGLTMYTLIQKLKKREPHSIKVCCMFNKHVVKLILHLIMSALKFLICLFMDLVSMMDKCHEIFLI